MSRILFTHQIPEVAFSLLEENDIKFDVMNKKRLFKKSIISELKKYPYDGMVTLLTDKLDSKFINELPKSVKIISNYAVGYNNIDITAARKNNIIITNTPGVLTNTVAEHTIGMMFSVATRSVESDLFVRKNMFTGWEPELLLGLDLKDKTIGIVGAGRIGTRVAEIAKGIGMNILYYDIQENSELENRTSARFCISSDELIRNSDVISIHLPLNDATYHFIDSRQISNMKSTAILINASRGPVVDEKALTNALKNRRIFGAALDVFEFEPNVSRELRLLPNVVLSPHTASASIGTRNAMARIVAENIIAFLHGDVAPNSVI